MQHGRLFATNRFQSELAASQTHLDILNHRFPEDVSYITLSHAILGCNPEKFAEIFRELPEHIKTINFDFKDMKSSDLPKCRAFMRASGYAKHVDVFNLSWDFDRFPASVLTNVYP